MWYGFSLSNYELYRVRGRDKPWQPGGAARRARASQRSAEKLANKGSAIPKQARIARSISSYVYRRGRACYYKQARLLDEEQAKLFVFARSPSSLLSAMGKYCHTVIEAKAPARAERQQPRFERDSRRLPMEMSSLHFRQTCTMPTKVWHARVTTLEVTDYDNL